MRRWPARWRWCCPTRRGSPPRRPRLPRISASVHRWRAPDDCCEMLDSSAGDWRSVNAIGHRVRGLQAYAGQGPASPDGRESNEGTTKERKVRMVKFHWIRGVVLAVGTGALLAACGRSSFLGSTASATSTPATTSTPSISATSFTNNFSAMKALTSLAAAGKGKIAAILPDTTSSTRYVEFD